MKYFVKLPDGLAYDYKLDDIRSDLRAGKITENCTVRQDGQKEWVTVRQFFENLGKLSPIAPGTVSSTVIAPGTVSSTVTDRAINRYWDAYLVARATTTIGSVVKTVGILFGILIVLIGLLMGADSRGNPMLIVAGLLLGVLVAIPFCVLGILVSANGQILKANLDGAVHSSPFLDDQQKASVMSLQ